MRVACRISKATRADGCCQRAIGGLFHMYKINRTSLVLGLSK
jgi:hypothetical protein